MLSSFYIPSTFTRIIRECPGGEKKLNKLFQEFGPRNKFTTDIMRYHSFNERSMEKYYGMNTPSLDDVEEIEEMELYYRKMKKDKMRNDRLFAMINQPSKKFHF